MSLIFSACLLVLYTNSLVVALPIVVKTVSNVTVSFEKLSLSLGLVEKLSSPHELNVSKVAITTKTESAEKYLFRRRIIFLSLFFVVILSVRSTYFIGSLIDL
jgi:hypothetical protein